MQDPAFLAMQRFGFGSNPIDRAAIGSDPKTWLTAQLADVTNTPPRLQALTGSGEVLMQAARARETRLSADTPEDRIAVRKETAEWRKGRFNAEINARIDIAAIGSAPLQERLVHFWSDHFTVSTSKNVVLDLAGPMEREAIRPNILGQFDDLLLAVVRHPAMLYYLDNTTSVGPDSKAGQRKARGLNENLGREILELHTLGVDGGYTQDDVIALAGALTGWSVHRASDNPDDNGFRFQAQRHQPGEQRVLGRRYAQAGAAQAEAILRDIARHPATARHVSHKLLLHFLGAAPDAARSALERKFIATDGNLAAVYETLIDLDLSWSTAPARFAPPDHWWISIRRLLGEHSPRGMSNAVANRLSQLGQRPFAAPSPAGWPKAPDAWLTPDGLWKRLETAQWIGARYRNRQPPVELAKQAMGHAMSSATRRTIAGAESRAQALAVLLTSPEWNRT